MAYLLHSQFGISDPVGMDAETIVKTRLRETGNEDISEFGRGRHHCHSNIHGQYSRRRPTGRLPRGALSSWRRVPWWRVPWWRVPWRPVAKLLFVVNQFWCRGVRIQPGRVLSPRVWWADLWRPHLWRASLSTLSSGLSSTPASLCGSSPLVSWLRLVTRNSSNVDWQPLSRLDNREFPKAARSPLAAFVIDSTSGKRHAKVVNAH